ncbi:unnamed protein product [Allacma fusca]|uniref:Uncharacterized protein n=1 Tax=Allacma fusca TaxID=39272 RepID=A0A8J2NM66_9HEXA|nr:unnamed protein product [Allacma fusca]
MGERGGTDPCIRKGVDLLERWDEKQQDSCKINRGKVICHTSKASFQKMASEKKKSEREKPGFLADITV